MHVIRSLPSISIFKWATAAVVTSLFSVSCSFSVNLDKINDLLSEPQFKLVPSSSDITEGGALQISGEDGTPPYTYEKVSGDGSVAADGTLTSATSGTQIMIKGTDQNGNIAFAVFNVVAKPKILPATKTLAVENKFQFSVVNGKTPYIFRIASGGGSVNTTGLFTAPSTSGTTTLEVIDSLGGIGQATITVVNALQISPTTLVMGPNTSQAFTTSGGVAPILLSVESGNGSINSTTGIFTSPGVAGTAVIKATDSLGNVSRSYVTINSALTIDPLSLELIVNASYTFQATGGIPPYAYSVSSGAGSINAASGLYTAPASTGSAQVTVTDSQGQTSVSHININLELTFVFPNVSMLINESKDLSLNVIGGVPPLTYTVSSGAGGINTSTGIFTAGTSPGTYTATVTDNQGHQAQAALTIRPPVSISPLNPKIMASTNLAFSASGGFGPYTFSVVSGGGSFSGALFTAPASAQSVTVRATDSLGHFASTTVTVTGLLDISPAAPAVIAGSTLSFSATGGITPYTYSVESGGGSINTTTGQFTASATPGTAIVRVTDAQGNFDESVVRVLEVLQFIPGHIAMAKSSSFTLLAVGGEPSYTFSIVSGAGTINSSTGLFTTPAVAGSISIRVTDSLGNTADGSIDVYESVVISPLAKTIVINETLTFTASGGQTPYAYSVESGGLSIDASSGLYTAPGTTGSATVRVTDNLGQYSEATVTISDNLSISPVSVNLAVNNSHQFTASGGVAPYIFSLTSGLGTTTTSGLYTAGSSAGSATIQVTDSGGRTATATINIAGALSISPSSTYLKFSDVQTFSASNGVGPYGFSVLSGVGSINASTGDYTAPASEGSAVVRVQDSLGNRADATIQIVAPVEISPATKSLAFNEIFTFLALKGLAPYTFSKVSGGGSIHASTGQFTAPVMAGTTVVRVTDSLSQTADATIAIYDALNLTPDLSAIATSQTQLLAITGGSAPYTYQLLSGTGAFDDGTMTYTAGTAPTTAKVKVTDNLGNIDIATINVVGAVTISPTTVTVIINENTTFTASGGSTPYTFSVVSGTGSINSSTGVFTAPATTDTTVVRVTDNLGQTADATITIDPALTISPTSVTLAIGNSQTFTASGGVGSYTFSIESGGGSINSSTGVYTASGTGPTVVKVTDSGGRTATATVTINGALTIAPTTLDTTFAGTQTFAGSGGVPPYSYTVVVPGTGSIDTTTGAYTAPNLAGAETVRVTDSLGNTANAVVTVYSPVQISPATLELVINASSTFSASGGKSPYAYSVVTGGGGSINSSTGSYTAPGTLGTYTVRVTDALGQTSDSTVTTRAILDLTPDSSTLAQNQTQVLSVAGGVSPYTYALISGLGSFDDGTMTYTAPAAPTVAQVRVTDASGNTDTISLTVVGPVSISPTTVTVIVNENTTFTASGGSTPYTFSVVSGTGSINASTGVFTAPTAADTTVVRVTDNLGQTADSTITIDPALTISPSSVTLAVNNYQTFSASGGVGPYTFSIQSGTGTINSSTGVYTAPAASGTAVVKVTDNGGRTSTATVTINGALAITPTTLETIYGGAQTFSGSGGVPPYSYTVVVPGAGSVGLTTGAYITPSIAGTETVRVTDSLSNTADATVTIFTPVQINPTTKTLTVNEVFTFTASGGKTPYAFSVSGGSVVAATGQYTAPATPGSHTVRVTDALGQTSDAVVTIESAIDLTPDSSTILVGQTKILSLSGGSAPFTYQVISGTGSFDDGTLTYTATTSPTVAQVRVTDSLAYTDTVTINVVADVPAGLSFLSSAQTVVAGACSLITEVGVVDQYGNPTVADASYTVNLSATNITFYSDNGCTSSVTSRTLSTGGNKVSFYFKSNVSGVDTITAAAGGLSNGSQLESITAGTLADVRFSPGSLSVNAGDCSSVTQVRLTDSLGNPGVPASNVNVTLAGSGVVFYTDASCSTSTGGSVTLTNGSPTQNVYVKKTLAEVIVATGTAGGYTTGNLNITVSPNVPYKLSYITQPSATGWNNTDLVQQPKLGIYDEYDNFVSTASNSITLSANSDSNCTTSAASTLSATTNPLVATSGAAQFAGVRYSAASDIYIKSAAAGLQSTCSNMVSIVADYSQTVSAIPANIPSDGLAEATVLIVPKLDGVNLGTGNVLEITSSSANVTMTCNGSACSACQTPAATCIRAYDYGQGAYSFNVKSSIVESVNFTVRHNNGGNLTAIKVLSTSFDTANFLDISTTTTITSANAGRNLYLRGGTVTFDATTAGQSFGDLFLRGSTVIHQTTTTTTVHRIDIAVGSLFLQSGSINVTALGYPTIGAGTSRNYSYGPTAPSTTLGSDFNTNNLYVAGGAHGGIGGYVLANVQSGATYGDYRDPYYPGGGGFASGGGVVRISSTGTCTINSGATILANGSGTSGGAGGSIKLTCAGFAGTAAAAAIAANGGAGNNVSRSAGGGGRVALISTGNTASFAGNFAFPVDSGKMTTFVSTVQARGGLSTGKNGGAGTIYIKHSGLTYGGLIAHNGNNSGENTSLPSLEKTTGVVSGSTLPFTTSLASGYSDLYKNMRLRPDITADNGTPNNLLDDNIVIISANSLSGLTLTGSIASVPSGVTLRTIEILDYLNVGGSANLSTGSDLVVLSGDFLTPALNFTNGMIALEGGANSYPGVNSVTLTSGTYNGTDLAINSLIISGGTANYSGTLNTTSLTVNSGTYTGGTINAQDLTLNGGTYTVSTSNITNDFTITGGTNASYANTIGRDLLVSGGTSTLESTTVGRDFLMSAGTLRHRTTTTTTVYRFEMSVAGSTTLNGGSINVTALGYPTIGAGTSRNYSYGPTAPTTTLGSDFNSNNLYVAGGAHGGIGGYVQADVKSGATYGNYRDPYYPGGGGFASGGGVVRISSTGTCAINSGASILANGSGTSGGAGGSIKLTCAGFAGTAAAASIAANGGAGNNANRSAGGGGRIALISTGNASSFAGNFAFPDDSTKMTAFVSTVQARGGLSTGKNGGAGTIYIKHSGLTYGGLIIHNGNTTGQATSFLSAVANSSVINNKVDSDTLQIGASGTPYASYINYFTGYGLHIWNTVGGNEDPLSASHVVASIISNGANTFVSSGSPYAGTSFAADHSYRITHTLDALYVGGNASATFGNSDLIISGSPGLACDFTSAVLQNFVVPAGSSISGGNSYSSTNCPSGNFSGTITFTRYCDGTGTCAP